MPVQKDWNPITLEQALKKEWSPYQASKTFAERAAWDFMEKEKPNFTLSTVTGTAANFHTNFRLTGG